MRITAPKSKNVQDISSSKKCARLKETKLIFLSLKFFVWTSCHRWKEIHKKLLNSKREQKHIRQQWVFLNPKGQLRIEIEPEVDGTYLISISECSLWSTARFVVTFLDWFWYSLWIFDKSVWYQWYERLFSKILKSKYGNIINLLFLCRQ